MSSLCVVSNKGGTERRSAGANRERDVSKYDSVIAGAEGGGEGSGGIKMMGTEVSSEKSRRADGRERPSRGCVRRP